MGESLSFEEEEEEKTTTIAMTIDKVQSSLGAQSEIRSSADSAASFDSRNSRVISLSLMNEYNNNNNNDNNHDISTNIIDEEEGQKVLVPPMTNTSTTGTMAQMSKEQIQNNDNNSNVDSRNHGKLLAAHCRTEHSNYHDISQSQPLKINNTKDFICINQGSSKEENDDFERGGQTSTSFEDGKNNEVLTSTSFSPKSHDIYGPIPEDDSLSFSSKQTYGSGGTSCSSSTNKASTDDVLVSSKLVECFQKEIIRMMKHNKQIEDKLKIVQNEKNQAIQISLKQMEYKTEQCLELQKAKSNIILLEHTNQTLEKQINELKQAAVTCNKEHEIEVTHLKQKIKSLEQEIGPLKTLRDETFARSNSNTSSSSDSAFDFLVVNNNADDDTEAATRAIKGRGGGTGMSSNIRQPFRKTTNTTPVRRRKNRTFQNHSHRINTVGVTTTTSGTGNNKNDDSSVLSDALVDDEITPPPLDVGTDDENNNNNTRPHLHPLMNIRNIHNRLALLARGAGRQCCGSPPSIEQDNQELDQHHGSNSNTEGDTAIGCCGKKNKTKNSNSNAFHNQRQDSSSLSDEIVIEHNDDVPSPCNRRTLYQRSNSMNAAQFIANRRLERMRSLRKLKEDHGSTSTDNVSRFTIVPSVHSSAEGGSGSTISCGGHDDDDDDDDDDDEDNKALQISATTTTAPSPPVNNRSSTTFYPSLLRFQSQFHGTEKDGEHRNSNRVSASNANKRVSNTNTTDRTRSEKRSNMNNTKKKSDVPLSSRRLTKQQQQQQQQQSTLPGEIDVKKGSSHISELTNESTTYHHHRTRSTSRGRTRRNSAFSMFLRQYNNSPVAHTTTSTKTNINSNKRNDSYHVQRENSIKGIPRRTYRGDIQNGKAVLTEDNRNNNGIIHDDNDVVKDEKKDTTTRTRSSTTTNCDDQKLLVPALKRSRSHKSKSSSLHQHQQQQHQHQQQNTATKNNSGGEEESTICTGVLSNREIRSCCASSSSSNSGNGGGGVGGSGTLGHGESEI